MQNAYFNSRPLYRGRLGRFKHIVRNVAISTHAPYTEGDIGNTQIRYAVKLFQLTPPIQRATPTYIAPIANVLFQLTPPIQRATHVQIPAAVYIAISTHAPYTEGDSGSCNGTCQKCYFNSRPLYRGRRLDVAKTIVVLIISTHAPYTEGDLEVFSHQLSEIISTHAPYTEGDKRRPFCLERGDLFQLTPPIQRATSQAYRPRPCLSISTHAPYTEGDLETRIPLRLNQLFQLTPPIQRATDVSVEGLDEGDYFNSRPLYRGRLPLTFTTKITGYFNSRPLYRGRPNTPAVPCGSCTYFNSRPLYRGRPIHKVK